jgi:hypothetical protein
MDVAILLSTHYHPPANIGEHAESLKLISNAGARKAAVLVNEAIGQHTDNRNRTGSNLKPLSRLRLEVEAGKLERADLLDVERLLVVIRKACKEPVIH